MNTGLQQLHCHFSLGLNFLIYRQVGLGSNVALDTITVPTEVILWRMIPNTTRSKCLNITAGNIVSGRLVKRL